MARILNLIINSDVAGITEEDVTAFVKQNKRQRITKMRLENIHEVWAINGKGFVVPVFAVTTTEEGIKWFMCIIQKMLEMLKCCKC